MSTQDMTTAEVIAPGPEELLRLDGDPAAGKLVEHLHFEDLSLRHTAWTMPRSGEVDGQAAAFVLHRWDDNPRAAAAVVADGRRKQQNE